jgi:hypothetical protein
MSDDQTLPDGADADKPVPDPKRRKRRWYQFGLLSLLVLVTLAAVGAWGWRVYLEPYRRQRATMALIERLGGSYKSEAADVWLRRLVDQDLQNITLVDVANWDEPGDYLDHVASLPALEALAIGGEAFGDEQLARLHGVKTLRALILDGTSVSKEGLTGLRIALPQIDTFFSQRRAIVTLRRNGFGIQADNSTDTALNELFGKAYFVDAVTATAPFRTGDADLAALKALTNLQELILSGTQVSDLGLAQVGELTSLEVLSVDGTHISNAGLVHLARLPKLRMLGLGDTRVTDPGLAHLSSMPALQELWIVNTRVSDAGLEHLKGCPNLHRVSLLGTLVTVGGVEDLQSALPKCLVWR